MFSRIAFVAVLGLLWLGSPASAQTQLNWKFKEGEVFFMDESNVADQVFTILGKRVEQKNTNRRILRYEVKSATPKGFVIEQTILSWRDKQEGGVVPPGGDDILERLVKGIVFRIQLNPDGSLAKYEGYEDLLTRARKEFPADEVKVFSSIVTEDLLKSSVELAFGGLPAKAVKPGDRWNRRLRVPAGPLGIFLFNDTMTYEGPGKGGERISVSTSFDYLPPKEGGGLPFRITRADLKANGAKSSLLFDAEKGRLVSFEGTFPMSGSMTLDVGGMMTSMELSATERRTIRLSDREPKRD